MDFSVVSIYKSLCDVVQYVRANTDPSEMPMIWRQAASLTGRHALFAFVKVPSVFLLSRTVILTTMSLNDAITLQEDYSFPAEDDVEWTNLVDIDGIGELASFLCSSYNVPGVGFTLVFRLAVETPDRGSLVFRCVVPATSLDEFVDFTDEHKQNMQDGSVVRQEESVRQFNMAPSEAAASAYQLAAMVLASSSKVLYEKSLSFDAQINDGKRNNILRMVMQESNGPIPEEEQSSSSPPCSS